MNDCSGRFAVEEAEEVAWGVHVEHYDWHRVLAGEGGGSSVHHFEATGQDVVVADGVEACGGGVLFGVGGVYAVHSGAFEHGVGRYFYSSEGGSGVGGEVRVAGSAGYDCHCALGEVVDSAAGGVVASDGVHGYCGKYFGGLPYGFKGRTECEAVDYGGEHTHLVARYAVEAAGGSAQTAEYVASADYDGYFGAALDGGLDLSGVFFEAFGADTVALIAGKRLTGEFEEDSVVFFHLQNRRFVGFRQR